MSRSIKVFAGFVLLVVTVMVGWLLYSDRQALVAQQATVTTQRDQLSNEVQKSNELLQAAEQALAELRAVDQFQRNETLQAEIKNIQTTFSQALVSYEKVLDLRGDGAPIAKIQPLEAQISSVLSLLSKRNYSSASASLKKLDQDAAALAASLATTEGVIPENVKASNSLPGSGYSKQVVESDAGKFVVDLLAADLNSTRVVVETASAGDCKDSCPVSSLGDFVARAGGFAGINGPYFCPAEYPSCAGKTNSFDTLMMNRAKTYFNSDNNVYSTVPAFVFSGSSGRLVGKSMDVGRDTGVDAVIASQPMLISGSEVVFGGDGDPKKGSRGSRSFIAAKGSQVYIGVVRGATVAEVARVLKALGVESALNLDSGGSTAFQVNGRYIAGPGRSTPFGIVLVRK